ncbi:hypothetical protein Nmel_001315 [Mimus melanotis]
MAGVSVLGSRNRDPKDYIPRALGKLSVRKRSNSTWPFVVSGRPDSDTKEVSTASRLCGTTAYEGDYGEGTVAIEISQVFSVCLKY